MTPQEKAKQLVDDILNLEYGLIKEYLLKPLLYAKQSALRTVDEIIKAWPHTYDLETEYTRDGDEIKVIKNVRSNIEYWQQVKQEINKL